MNQGISILLVTAIPIILFIWLLYKRKWKFWLDDKGLHLQPLFWFLITLPLIISAILWLLISEDYSLNLTKDGYNQFIEYAKLPLLILTLSPILGAFVINAHRSIQIAKQIEETEKKNRIDSYISNVKFTIDMLSSIETNNGIRIKNTYRLYSSAYNLKSRHHNEVNIYFLKLLNEKIDNINNSISEINRLDTSLNLKNPKKINSIKDSFERILFSVNQIEKILHIKIEYNYYEISNNILKEDTALNKNDFNELLKYYLKQKTNLFIVLDDIGELIYKICTILFPNKDELTLFPGITPLCNEINRILRPEYNGDKVATENQNNHK